MNVSLFLAEKELAVLLAVMVIEVPQARKVTLE
jgi:hypothetical protein